MERAVPGKIDDSELLDWLGQADDEERELIVEAAVPRRIVSFRAAADGRLLPSAMTETPSRTAVLEELDAYLRELLATPPTLLKSAGAAAVRATRQELEALLDHPLVRGVRPNRRLLPPRQQEEPPPPVEESESPPRDPVKESR